MQPIYNLVMDIRTFFGIDDPKTGKKDFIKGCVVFAVVFVAAVLICDSFRKLNVVDGYASPVFVLAVLLVSRFTEGYFFGLLTAVLSVIGVNYMFTYPYMKLNFTITGYPLTFVVFLVVATVTCTLTSRAKQNEELRLENEKQRMHGDLLRSISHDIRTPLTSIAGATSAVLESPEMSVEERNYLLTDAKDEAQRLISIVENILSMTRISSNEEFIKLEPWDVSEIIGSVLVKFRKRYPDVHVSADLPAGVTYAEMDPLLIEQVLTNLLENAMIHGKKTGNIEIRVFTDNDDVHIEVKDDGVGFTQEALKNAFKGAVGRGTKSYGTRNMGLGLAVCQSIIRAHGGTINAWNSKSGKGAVIGFVLKKGDITGVDFS